MPKVRNTQRFPLDVEIDNKVEKAEKEGDTDKVTLRENIHLGPIGTEHGISRELDAEEMESESIKRYLTNGFLVKVEEAVAEQVVEGVTETAASTKANRGKDGDK